MKRVKTITAIDGDHKVIVTVRMSAPASELSRSELDNCLESMTSMIMRVIPDAPYLGTRLSQLVVK